MSLHEIGNDSGIRVVNFTTLIVRSTVFPHLNVHKSIQTSAYGKTHNEPYHVLIDKR